MKNNIKNIGFEKTNLHTLNIENDKDIKRIITFNLLNLIIYFEHQKAKY